MVTRNRINFSEQQAVLLWQQLTARSVLSTEGETLGIIYPGRRSGDSGPDFRDAAIATQLGLTRGDVEIHVRSTDWYGHEHHANAAYNNVVLHVVMWHDCHLPTLLQDGRRVPVLCLAEALRQQPYLLPSRLPCSQILSHIGRQTLEKSLKSAGERRFRQKAARFQSQMLKPALSEITAGQALYRGIMRALGYARNVRPFEELAGRMPLGSIQFAPGLIPKQSLLLGTAGLLPSQRRRKRHGRAEEVRKLEQTWRSVAKAADRMTESEWTFSHIYPNNSPVRRIVAGSYLLERYRENGLAPGILRLVREAPLSNGRRTLETGLAVAAEGYWRNHIDFDVRNATEVPAVLGSSKAGEIAVNVILPFAFSWGRLFGEPELMTKSMGLYNSYPKLADNEITRHVMGQLCLNGSSGLTACGQQGLIHIFRNYCREGKCNECPLLGQA